jgi:transcriptional regulator with XRE-family HTH domain/GTPase SAR1 family protein
MAAPKRYCIYSFMVSRFFKATSFSFVLRRQFFNEAMHFYACKEMSVTHLESDSMANYFLRQAREEKGWTQRRLAEKVGVSEQTVRSWERGTRTPSLEMRNRLCHVLEKSPSQLGLQRAEPAGVDASPSRDSPLTHRPDNPDRIVPRSTDVNRSRMIKRVWTIWIEGVFKHSLYQETLIVLGLQEQPDALINPWRLEVQETNLPPRPILPGTTILDIYDDTDGNLLVLGAPGAGKTTLLLDLARHLLDRAQYDEQHPIPVVFNLAPWAEKRPPLEDWLVQELSTKYQVPRAVGKTWVVNDRLLLLLDGLDEVATPAITACINAINTYRHQHGLVPIVICCRNNVYFSQPDHLLLDRAITIQPLTRQQMNDYLSKTKELATLRAILDDPSQQSLQELASTPLMLNILTHISIHHAVPHELARDAEHHSTIFQEYVKRVISHRGESGNYSHQQTEHWLAWLAHQLIRHNQTEIYLERIQPDWLDNPMQRSSYLKNVIRLNFGVRIVLSAGLFTWLRGGTSPSAMEGVKAGLLSALGAGSYNTILGWMAPGLGGGTGGGGSLGIILALVTVLALLLISSPTIPTISLAAMWRGLFSGLFASLRIGIAIGLFAGLLFGLARGFHVGLTYGMGLGLFGGLLAGLLVGITNGLRPAEPQEKKDLRDRLFDTALFTLCATISNGTVYALLIHAVTRTVVIEASVIGLFYGVAFGLTNSTKILYKTSEIQPAEIVSWSWTTIRRNLGGNIRKGLIVEISVMIPVTIVIGCISAFFYGPLYGVHYGLVFGPIIGLIGGMTSILTSMLNNGWSSNQLEEHRLSQPNEGIRRSLRNGLFAAAVFGPMAGFMSGLVCGLAFQFIGGLPTGIILGIAFTIILSAVFAFEFFAIHGGSAWLEHYLLRWYLWQQGVIPWNYIHFLEYATDHILLRKVGAGYIFIHRLLLEYFAGPKNH